MASAPGSAPALAPATTAATAAAPKKNPPPKSPRKSRRPNYNYIHRNLLPVEVQPLPVLIPHNPLSLVAIALSYLVQVLAPSQQPLYNGYFSSATSSIHVTDPNTIRKLWEMGFFGRGSLSRSEPTWLENRKKKGSTAEENTAQRRLERRQLKQERAKKEQEEIDQQLAQESTENDSKEPEPQSANGHVDGSPNGQPVASTAHPIPPHGPTSHPMQMAANESANGGVLEENVVKTNACDMEDIGSVLDAASSGSATPDALVSSANFHNGSIHGFDEWKKAIEANGIPTPPPTSNSSDADNHEARPVKRLQRTKTVRFSPTIEAREFDLSSPVISPIKSPGASPLVPPPAPVATAAAAAPQDNSENQEHLTLSLEEAFFLSYSLGVLKVYCDDSDTVMPPSSLLSLFRRHSYHPPRSLSVPAQEDDPFLPSYVVYHHYRSLGWVVRSGVKFGVDYLLYNRGPAFSHAEFAVCIMPSYSHPYWTSQAGDRAAAVEKRERKEWWWLHGVNRVQAQVHKQLVLCYVDVPPPLDEGDKSTRGTDIGFLLARYKVRDICVRRWTPNRSRD